MEASSVQFVAKVSYGNELAFATLKNLFPDRCSSKALVVFPPISTFNTSLASDAN